MRLEDGTVVRSEAPTTTIAEPAGEGTPGWLRLVLAVASGVALALAFPPFGWEWTTPLAVATLTLACRGARPRMGALLGLVFGLGFLLLLLQWVRVIGVDAWLALSLIEALFIAVLGAALTLVTRLRWWPLWAAALWVGVEFARASFPLGGFPWGRLAYALDDTPMAALASLGGVPLVTFVVALAGNVLLWAVVASRRGPVPRIFAVAVAGALAFGGLLVPLPTEGIGFATVAIVQGNVPSKGLEFLGRARTVTRNHLEATEQLMREVRAGKLPKPDFVLWPENSTDIDPFTDAQTRSIVEQAVQTAGVPVLVGAVLDGPGPNYRRTTGVVWDPTTGPGQIYAKQHPVPFGEYIPFRRQLLPYIDRLQLVGRDTYAGTEPGKMRIAGYRVGEVICFEVAYDGIVREVAAGNNSQFLTVQTNNATYTDTGQPQQQFAITRLRSIEYGKATLVASPNGISGAIAPDGKIVAQSKEATRQVYVERVPLRTTPTLAARLGPVPEWVLSLAGLAAIVAALIRRRRPSAGAGPAGPKAQPTGGGSE
ncbi:apolipoprotein N-acyltransferase [Actinopolymorpha pittospori]|uniref:Apolipoprotein N-acyltransferase n=1 Tax=Actinopolymorpha pittospori TaxID=648752 RepID=A0A927N2I4_9ACTN|nr:apolipoprotein N-acyltransferase [Actinopolymorpha pittospori]MBE1610552.1 apolipoprotein N-acyltransferase [Actinopolymorpha pittospori]